MLLDKVVIQENVSPVRLDAGLVSVSMAIVHTGDTSGYAVQIQSLLWCVDIFTDPGADLFIQMYPF